MTARLRLLETVAGTVLVLDGFPADALPPYDPRTAQDSSWRRGPRILAFSERVEMPDVDDPTPADEIAVTLDAAAEWAADLDRCVAELELAGISARRGTVNTGVAALRTTWTRHADEDPARPLRSARPVAWEVVKAWGTQEALDATNTHLGRMVRALRTELESTTPANVPVEPAEVTAQREVVVSAARRATTPTGYKALDNLLAELQELDRLALAALGDQEAQAASDRVRIRRQDVWDVARKLADEWGDATDIDRGSAEWRATLEDVLTDLVARFTTLDQEV